MDELRQHLDDEARRVEEAPGALEAVKRRTGRRRVTRQIGTGTLALAVAAGGFALAWNAFQGGPVGRPLVGPSNSMSPSPGGGLNVLVIGPGGLGDEADEVSARMGQEGYDVEATIHCVDCPVPDSTTIEYRPEVQAEAESIRDEFLPGAELQEISTPPNRGRIHVSLGADYDEISSVVIRVLIVDGSGLPGAADAAATILEGEGYEVVDVTDARLVHYDETFITCASRFERVAERFRDVLFPKAEIRPAIPQKEHDITLYVGGDFYDDYGGELDTEGG